MVYLLADCGSTKTDWCLTKDGVLVQHVRTAGINPVYLNQEEVECIIRQELLPALCGCVPDSLHFYGAGCATPELTEHMRTVLRRCLCPQGEVEVCSDMVGAARALLGTREGIACILGTGSNSCFWDGKRMAQNVPPLGFILGDEGSGAYLGKRLVSDLMRGILPRSMREDFLSRYGLTMGDIIERVYRHPFPNRFLASFAPFIADNLNERCVYRLVFESFRAFIRRNIGLYYRWRFYPVCFTGSIAWHFRDVLIKAAESDSVRIHTIVPSPMGGLIRFHLHK